MNEIKKRIGEIIATNKAGHDCVLPVYQMMRRYQLFEEEYWQPCEKFVETVNGGEVVYDGSRKTCIVRESGETLNIVSVNCL